MNKITFCSFPDTIDSAECYAIKNYSNTHIKSILNSFDQDTVFYLLDNSVPNEWLNNVLKKVKIVFDCDKMSLEQIRLQCQKKQ